MRILFVNPTADLYGASRCLLRLIASLDKQKYSSYVILPEEGPLADAIRQEGATIFVLPYLGVIRRRVIKSWRVIPFVIMLLPAIVRIYWLIKRNNIQLVHSNSGVIFTSALAAKLAGARHVWHLREMFADEFAALWKYFGPFMLRFSDQILCVSTSIAKQFAANHKVRVVYDGLEPSAFTVDEVEKSIWREKFSTNAKTHLVGVVGRISPRKGQDVFVKAAAILKKRGYYNVCYLIIGDTFAGNEYVKAELEALISANDLEDDVVFTGYIAQPKTLIAAHDIVVLPSTLPEAFPGVVLESMALGIPVIATDNGGQVEQIEQGLSGILIPPNNEVALANAIQSLLDDPESRMNMGERGHARVQSLFSLQRNVSSTCMIYENLL